MKRYGLHKRVLTSNPCTGVQMFEGKLIEDDEGEWVKWSDLAEEEDKMAFVAEAEEDFEDAKEALYVAARRLTALRAAVSNI